MRTTTLILILNNEQNKFLMGNHKRGEGKGRLSFLGGKVGDKQEFINETPVQSAQREILEEANIKPLEMFHLADISYCYPNNHEKRDELMKVYQVAKYEGDIKEDPEELSLEWVGIYTIPFERMWPSDRLWLPRLLEKSSYFHVIDFNYDKDACLVDEHYRLSGKPFQVL